MFPLRKKSNFTKRAAPTATPGLVDHQATQHGCGARPLQRRRCFTQKCISSPEPHHGHQQRKRCHPPGGMALQQLCPQRVGQQSGQNGQVAHREKRRAIDGLQLRHHAAGTVGPHGQREERNDGHHAAPHDERKRRIGSHLRRAPRHQVGHRPHEGRPEREHKTGQRHLPWPFAMGQAYGHQSPKRQQQAPPLPGLGALSQQRGGQQHVKNACVCMTTEAMPAVMPSCSPRNRKPN